ncbi:secreted RxLR effector protein 161-like [Lactuca sativa]|uniref:secreted RxLR effector protein 161-like n=1 Tax=Lactuca sativa TaxID=4236 RepID=UPI0022AFF078|nr:secreted RxLR effector protein 161-like [Lactuca sativa]
MTRPDISYAVQILSQYMHKPYKSHVNIALRLLRYLKDCPGKGIHITKTDSLSLIGSVDADWAKCLFSRRSVTGYLVYFAGSLVSWKSKKQSTVSRSSTESEYKALGSVTCEIIWILKLLYDLGITGLNPVNIFCDNESAIKLVLNPVFHERSKHFEVDLHFVREKVENGIIKVNKIDSLNQNADVLTKALGSSQHEYIFNRLGLINVFKYNKS